MMGNFRADPMAWHIPCSYGPQNETFVLFTHKKGGDMLMARDFIPFLNTPLTARLWKIGIAVLAGVGGNIVLINFLFGLMTAQTLTGLLDWIVGFNTALTGFMLVEKDTSGLPFRRGLCLGAGLANTGITILAVNYLYQLMWDFPLIALADAVILLTIGAILGFLGGQLAEKYLEFKKNVNRTSG